MAAPLLAVPLASCGVVVARGERRRGRSSRCPPWSFHRTPCHRRYHCSPEAAVGGYSYHFVDRGRKGPMRVFAEVAVLQYGHHGACPGLGPLHNAQMPETPCRWQFRFSCWEKHQVRQKPHAFPPLSFGLERSNFLVPTADAQTWICCHFRGLIDCSFSAGWWCCWHLYGFSLDFPVPLPGGQHQKKPAVLCSLQPPPSSMLSLLSPGRRPPFVPTHGVPLWRRGRDSGLQPSLPVPQPVALSRPGLQPQQEQQRQN